jgi:hypothetical protein
VHVLLLLLLLVLLLLTMLAAHHNNTSMQMLAVVSTIFLPITFLAGESSAHHVRPDQIMVVAVLFPSVDVRWRQCNCSSSSCTTLDRACGIVTCCHCHVLLNCVSWLHDTAVAVAVAVVSAIFLPMTFLACGQCRGSAGHDHTTSTMHSALPLTTVLMLKAWPRRGNSAYEY